MGEKGKGSIIEVILVVFNWNWKYPLRYLFVTNSITHNITAFVCIRSNYS
jgi:hypothetical protein